ncbi:polysaccharide deacetylase family protein [Kitasatospora sp. NPDC098663]|uniref:polysaccharide deacetylase family protein n=1 Tax=Kitasatospora sp. NPDC098663 TaxID=3364096 RepID=UPI0037FCED60
MRQHREPKPSDPTPPSWYPGVGRTPQPSRRRTAALRTAVLGAAALTLVGAAGALMKAPERLAQPAGSPAAAASPASASAATAPDPTLPAPVADMSISRQSEDPGKTVNLTIDDGPDPQWTPRILDVLARNDAKAVFCMLGPNAQAHPDLAKQVVAAGHRLCDHSVSHDTAMDHKDAAYQEREIVDGLTMIQDATGGAPVPYYRAPGGAFTPESRQIAAAHGMRPLGWNADTRDFERPGVDKIVETAKAQLRIGPTILLHDGGGNRAQTLAALEQLLPWFKDNGYTFSFPKR